MKAENLINNNSLTNIVVEDGQNVVSKPIALTAINMARKEEKEKAKKAFCQYKCKIVCRESDYDNGCQEFEEFANKLETI